MAPLLSIILEPHARRVLVLWTAMALYGASILTCIMSVVLAWSRGVPWRGPASRAYVNPWAFLFLGAGFLVSSLGNYPPTTRVLVVLAGLFQVFVFFFVRFQRHRSGKHSMSE